MTNFEEAPKLHIFLIKLQIVRTRGVAIDVLGCPSQTCALNLPCPGPGSGPGAAIRRLVPRPSQRGGFSNLSSTAARVTFVATSERDR